MFVPCHVAWVMAVAHRDVGGLLKKHGYKELRKIGEGSFGKAVLVKALDSDKELVCKMVDVSKASPKETQDAVKEGKLLAQFKHPYVVRYRDNFLESGWLCIIMDYCEGGELGKEIQKAKKSRKPFTEDQILRWLTQATLALKYIHDKHILHRDLKPANFFLSKNGSIKMGDFGIAKVLSNTLACAKTQIGTPYYLSPEVCQEKPYAWASDIWALGCILYEMCALKVPFDSTSIPGLVQKICRGPIPTVTQPYSDFTRQLCSEMLNRNPNSRPSTDDILQKPRIQQIVRQMLDEAQASQSQNISKVPCNDENAPPNFANGPMGIFPEKPDKLGSPDGDRSGAYKKGDTVWYYSGTHKDWLPATIIEVDATGGVFIDLKPNNAIGIADQSSKMKLRKQNGNVVEPVAPRPEPAPVPRAAAYSPMCQRSPSVGALGRNPSKQACPSPLRQRSPSVEALRRNSPSPGVYRNPSIVGTPRNEPGSIASRAPSPRQRGFSPAPGGAGSRCATPVRGQKPLSPSQIRPPCMPPQKPESPLFRRNAALAAAGMGIVGT